MSASEQPKQEAERRAEDDNARQATGGPAERVHEVPLFLRNKSDGRKGNAQDEKDEIGE